MVELCSGAHQAKTHEPAELSTFLEPLGENPLPGSFGVFTEFGSLEL